MPFLCEICILHCSHTIYAILPLTVQCLFCHLLTATTFCYFVQSKPNVSWTCLLYTSPSPRDRQTFFCNLCHFCVKFVYYIVHVQCSYVILPRTIQCLFCHLLTATTFCYFVQSKSNVSWMTALYVSSELTFFGLLVG